MRKTNLMKILIMLLILMVVTFTGNVYVNAATSDDGYDELSDDLLTDQESISKNSCKY